MWDHIEKYEGSQREVFHPVVYVQDDFLTSHWISVITYDRITEDP